MTDESKDFGSPFGPSPFAPAPPPPEPAPEESGPPSALRRATPIAAFLMLAVLAAAAVGAVAGHEVWTATTTEPVAVAPPTSNGGSSSSGNVNPFPGGSSGTGSTTPSNAGGGPSDPGAIAAKVGPALVDINSDFGFQGAAGAGTGIVLSSNGEVLTNNHVIAAATRITATDIGNGKTYDATVVGYDPSHDIAVLQLQGASGLATAELGDSSNLSAGQAVVGIGNAGGAGGTPSAAGGQITGLNQSVQARDDNGSTEQLSGMIGVNANIQPGDSGGPLVDSQGRVIGMDTAGSQGFSFSGASVSSGEAFAIPIATAASTALQIVTNHPSETTHVGPTAFLGVTVASSGGGIAIPGLGTIGGSSGASPGVQLGSILNGQAAAGAGLVAGDTITSIDGTAIDSPGALSHAMLGHHPGDVVKLGYTDTSGVARTVDIKLGSGPAS